MIVEQIYQNILDTWGEKIQKVIIVEEICEFTKELTKILRKGFGERKKDFIIEYVDVIIVLKQLLCILGDNKTIEMSSDDEICIEETINLKIIGEQNYLFRAINTLSSIAYFVSSLFEDKIENTSTKKKEFAKKNIVDLFKMMAFLKNKFNVTKEIKERYDEKLLEIEKKLFEKD